MDTTGRESSFEYRIVSGAAKTRWFSRFNWSKLEAEVNALIVKGWEVVSSDVSVYSVFFFGCGGQSPMATFVLRRPIAR